MYPAMLELSDVPNRHELADQLRRVAGVAAADAATDTAADGQGDR
jgi:hypothetical protein